MKSKRKITIKNFENAPKYKGIPEGKPVPIWSGTQALILARVNEQFMQEFDELYNKIIEFGRKYYTHPDKVFEALKEYDEQLKKQ